MAVQPVKRRNWPIVLAIVGGVLALCCIVGVIAISSGGSNDQSNQTDAGNVGVTSATGAASRTGPGGAAPGIDTPVRDGKFEFVVSKVECGQRTVGEDFAEETADGQFCLVYLTVKNIGRESQTFSDSDQKAIGPNGTEYSADTVAGIAANNNSDVFLNEINPGNQVEGIVVFDIPTNSKIAGLELHDSPLSNGVELVVG